MEKWLRFSHHYTWGFNCLATVLVQIPVLQILLPSMPSNAGTFFKIPSVGSGLCFPYLAAGIFQACDLSVNLPFSFGLLGEQLEGCAIPQIQAADYSKFFLFFKGKVGWGHRKPGCIETHLWHCISCFFITAGLMIFARSWLAWCKVVLQSVNIFGHIQDVLSCTVWFVRPAITHYSLTGVYAGWNQGLG